MKLPLLQVDNFSIKGQVRKITEEFEEFLSELEGTEEEAKEILDFIQAGVTYLTHTQPKEVVERLLLEHCDKFVGRGWELKGFLNIKFKGE